MKQDKKECLHNCPCNSYCPQQKALSLIGGKWKVPILCALNQDGVSRYNDLKNKITGITNTMLASSLKELERDGLVSRTQFIEMPVRVEYGLTEKGKSVGPILDALASWGLQN